MTNESQNQQQSAQQDNAQQNVNASQQVQQDVPQQVQQNVNPLQGNAVNRIQVRIPPFWKQNPQLWFRQLEAQFATSGITSDLTKFNTIVGVMESDILSSVSDIVLSPPAANLYDAIKQRLIKQYAETDVRKIKNLLHDLTLGDMKPSSLLRRMRELSCGKFSDELLKTLWLQRLPISVQTILSVSNEDLDQLTRMADAMLDVIELPAIQAVTAAQSQQNTQVNRIDDLVNAVCQLEGKFDRLSRDFRRPGKRNGQSSRHRSPTPSKASSVSTDEFCFYHKKFGNKAFKCRKPCDFKVKKSEN